MQSRTMTRFTFSFLGTVLLGMVLQGTVLQGTVLQGTVLAEGITVQGRVLTAEGKPLAGATARLASIGSQFEVGERQMGGHVDLSPESTAKVDSEGRFRLAAPGPGLWQVDVTAPGYRSLKTQISPLLEDVVLSAVRLEAARDLVVKVRGAKGEALAGALVVANSTGKGTGARLSRGSRRRSLWNPSFLYGRTDEKGEVRFQPEVEEEIEIHAWAPGHLPSSAKAAGRVARVELAPGAVRLLEVRDFRGRPAAGVLVQVSAYGWPVGWTDKEGRITVTAPVAGDPQKDLRIALHAELISVSGLRLVTPPAPKPSPEGDLPRQPTPEVFNLPEPQVVVGTVVDRDSKAPVPGAFVWSGDGAAFGGRTDRGGSFSLVMVPGGRRGYLKAAALGYRVETLEVREGAPRLTISLEPAVSIEGRVVDESGRALVGVEVRAQAADSARSSSQEAGSGTATTGKDGEFRLPGLKPIVAYRIEAHLDGFAPATVEAVTSEAARPGAIGVSEVLEITLLAGRRAFGLVVDEGEVPIAGARVKMGRSLEGTGRQALMRAFSPSEGQGELLTTDAEGRFEARDVAAGRYDLRAEAAGFAPLTVRGIEIPAGGGETEMGTVILSPGMTLEGRVVDEQKNPVEQARVSLRENRAMGVVMTSRRGLDAQPNEVTDLDGRFALRDLAEGTTVTLDVAKEGFQNRSLSGIQVPPDAPLEIVLEKAFRVSGRVLGPDGEPLERAWAQLGDGGAGISVGGRRLGGQMFHLRAPSEKDGTFEIAGVPPGSYTLEASARGFLPSLAVDVEVDKEDAEGLTLALRVGATVQGRVFSPEGSPVAQAHVLVSRDQENSFRPGSRATATTDASGRYRLEGVEIGNLTLQASHKEYSQVSKNFLVKPGENSLDLTMEQGVEVSGRVVTATGEPVAGAQVRLTGDRSFGFGGGDGTVSMDDGTFRLTSVSRGRYRVEAEKEGLVAGRSANEIDVASEPVLGVEVVLQGGVTVVGRVTGLEFDVLSSLQIFAFSQTAGMAVGSADYEGRYRLGPLGPGTWIVQATATAGGRQVMKQVVVEEGDAEKQVDLDFAGGFDLQGRVLQGGKPFKNARIFAQSLEGGSSGSGSTDFEGRFLLSGLEAGRYSLSVFEMTSGVQHSEEVTVGGEQEIVVEVGAAFISGIVRSGADGAPMASVTVDLTRVADKPGPGFGLDRTVSTDSQGRFLFEAVSEGSWRVTAREKGFGPAQQTLSVVAADGGTGGAEGVDLTLQPTEGLFVDVFLPEGRPAVRVEALLADGSGNVVAEGSFRLSEEGRFHFDTAPPGRWRLQVSGGGASADGLAQVAVPGPPVRVQLPAAGWLSLSVPELEAAGLVATLAIQGSDGLAFLPMRSSTPGMTGGFVLLAGRLPRQPLPPGIWTLAVTSPDGRTWTGTANIQGGATAEVVLE